MKIIKRIIFALLFTVGIALFFYRLSGYTFMKAEYPNDEINITFFMLKILREVGIWFLTCMPITFLVFQLMSYRDKMTYILSAGQILVHIIGLTLLIIFCRNINKVEGIVTFVVYAVVVIVCVAGNILYYRTRARRFKPSN
jgi:Ca2+/Na+ antiporter